MRNEGQPHQQPVVMRGPVVVALPLVLGGGGAHEEKIYQDKEVVHHVQVNCAASVPCVPKGSGKVDSASRWQTSEAKRHLIARLENPKDAVHTMTLDEIYLSSALYGESKKKTSREIFKGFKKQ